MFLVAAGSAGYLTFAAIVTRTWRAPNLSYGVRQAALAVFVMVTLGTLLPIGSVWDGAFTALGLLLVREGVIQASRLIARIRMEREPESDLRPPARGANPAPARAVASGSTRR